MSLKSKGQLYCVALPIGNPTDLTQRAWQILESVDLIAAEDTRVFKTLCAQIQLIFKAQLISYYDAKEVEKSKEVLDVLLQGKSVAIVSDAGTPNIYDPGFRILELAFENEINVIPLPGASSLTAALSICPLPGLNFCFYGFAPEKSGARIKLFSQINFEGRIVFFESPHRIISHLTDAQKVWGSENLLFICRELTKKYEEKGLKTIGQWISHFEEIAPKGEFVLIYDSHISEVSKEDLDQWLQDNLRRGVNPREILKEGQSRFKITRKELYNKILQLNEKK